MAPLNPRFSNALHLASRSVCPSARLTTCLAGRPATLPARAGQPLSYKLERHRQWEGGFSPSPPPISVGPPGARLGLYSLSCVYKWEHLFYEKCNAILLLAWIKLMNVSGDMTLRCSRD